MSGNQNNNQNNQNKKPEDIKRRNNTLFAIGIVILVVILALVVGKKKTDAPAAETPIVTEENTETTTEGTMPVPGSYQDALEAYIGRSVQFALTDGVCSGFPTTQVFKVGSRVLLDNHGTEPVTVVFQGKTVTLKPFHYATMPLSTEGTFAFKCADKDVANVVVQK